MITLCNYTWIYKNNYNLPDFVVVVIVLEQKFEKQGWIIMQNILTDGLVKIDFSGMCSLLLTVLF